MTIPWDRNITLKKLEKKSKCKDLGLEMQRIWERKTEVIPVDVGALGTVKKGILENITKVSQRATVTENQKICILGSTRILRKVLRVWTEWLTWVTGAWFAPGWSTKRTPTETVTEETIIIIDHNARRWRYKNVNATKTQITWAIFCKRPQEHCMKIRVAQKCRTAISTCSRQFQFAHGDFNLLTAISIFSRQRSRHFSLRSPPVNFGGRQWPPKVKTQTQKSSIKAKMGEP